MAYETRKRPPYKEFLAWMLLNDVTRKDLIELLNISETSLSHRLNGTGADFTMDEVRTIISHFGEQVAQFFLS